MPNSVIEHYTQNYNEDKRHENPFGFIQEIRSKQLIERYLKDAPMSVLDIGGATGVYSFWLADLGHTVSLLDIVPLHTETVTARNAKRQHKLQHILTGDAQNYEFPDTYDLILLHGPLYHIVEREKRVAMLNHIRQYLNPSGVILGFAIHRYAGYFYGVRSGSILEENYKKIVLEEVKTGVRQRGTDWYFHTPNELHSEFEEVGLIVDDLKSVTTQVWMLPEIADNLTNQAYLESVLELAEAMEDEVEIGQDLMCAGK